jgi:exopolyphosphatase/guanosine-5'-triphosphate,3'-diphosphate pyrophosphatase
MRSKKIGPSGRVVAFIDIGTNSVRMMVVRLNPNNSYSILSRQKQQVRLGDGEFDEEEIQPDAIERTTRVCKQFTDLARSFNAEEFVAVATSAAREATNQNELLTMLRHEALLDVRVISGKEEARLIYLGVASGMHLSDRQTLFIDIGGGSTEIAVGGQQQYQFLESFRLGAIRLTNQFFPQNDNNTISREQYTKIQQFVKNAIVHSIQKIQKQKLDLAIGSSGTIINLAEIAQKNLHQNGRSNGSTLTYRDLRKVIDLLCALPLEQRKKVLGMNPDRADIIIAGAAILDTFMNELSLDSISITGRGLQDGLLVDYLSRIENFPLFGELSPREHSVLQLGRSCSINEVHSRTVTGLVLELFDSAKEVKMHNFGEWERELLEYATFLHDIGSFISFTNHHAHSYYIIKNSELLGFDQNEITIMANFARFHRKKMPRKKNFEISDLNQREQEMVRVLSTFLRLGESLDRSHAALVQHVKFFNVEKNTVNLNVITRGDCQLEIWGVESEQRAFEKVFGKRLILEIIGSDPVPGDTISKIPDLKEPLN